MVAPGTCPLPSAEIFLIPLEKGRHIVYAPLPRAAFVANAKAVNFLADLHDGIYNADADPDGALLEIFRSLEIVDGAPELPPITGFAGPPEPTAVTLFLTTKCNLRCTYCYAGAGDAPTKSMPLAVANRGIDFIIGNAVKKDAPFIEVAYHGGGEPSVNWRVLTRSLDYAREKAKSAGIDVRSTAATNGVLGDAKIDWIIDNLEGVSLSFDGLPTMHDAHRVSPSGKGSSEQVIKTIRRFENANFPYGIRVTVTRDKISCLPDSVTFIFANFRPERVQVEPAYRMGRWAEAPSAETDAFIEAFREAQARAADHGGEITFSAARLGTLTNHFCAVSQDNFCLTPDGNVSACYEAFSEDVEFADKMLYGRPDKIASGFAFDMEVLDRLRGQAVQHREHCAGCFAKWSCAGDCYFKALTVNGGDPFAGTERCHIVRELTKDQIVAAIAASGGLFWHAPPENTEG